MNSFANDDISTTRHGLGVYGAILIFFFLFRCRSLLVVPGRTESAHLSYNIISTIWHCKWTRCFLRAGLSRETLNSWRGNRVASDQTSLTHRFLERRLLSGVGSRSKSGVGLRRKERLLCLVAVMIDDAMKAHLLIYTHVRYCRAEFDRWKLDESIR